MLKHLLRHNISTPLQDLFLIATYRFKIIRRIWFYSVCSRKNPKILSPFLLAFFLKHIFGTFSRVVEGFDVPTQFHLKSQDPNRKLLVAPTSFPGRGNGRCFLGCIRPSMLLVFIVKIFRQIGRKIKRGLVWARVIYTLRERKRAILIWIKWTYHL